MAFRWEQTVLAIDEGRLLRDVLRDRVRISQRLLHSLKYQGTITVNNLPVTVRAIVHAGDIITLCLTQNKEQRVIPEQLPLAIIYEDEDLLVVNKPAEMITHPVPPEPVGTLANAVAWHWSLLGITEPVRVITRLDRNTTGLVLIARNAFCQHYYNNGNAPLRKRYLAIVHGRPAEDNGLIDLAIGIDPLNPVTRRVDPAGKPAQTVWRVVSHSDDFSLVEAELLTGRTHQIRVHLAALGHPILGDEQYGSSSSLATRQALHCWKLGLCHVRSEELQTFMAPLPADMQKLCAELGITPEPDAE